MKLSDKQKEIIESKEKHIVVTAGAGSGKTTVLVEHALNIVKNKTDNSKILVLTYSNKAARELEDRAKCSINNYMEHMYIGTIHKFCTALIGKYSNTIGLDLGFQILDSNEERLEIFKNAIDNFPNLKHSIMSMEKPDKEINKLFETMGMMKRNINSIDKIPLEHQQLFEEYDELMSIQNSIDFDDILRLAYKILNEMKGVLKIYQKTFTSICVDEAQDLNNIQYNIIKTLAGDQSSLFFVGDPNQAIYGFNGSSSSFMTYSIKKDYPDVIEFSLNENYRSSKAVIDAAKKIEPNFSLDGKIAIRGEFNIECFDDEKIEAEEVVKKIEELLQNSHPDIGDSIDPNNICILARNRYVLDNVHKLLIKRNIESTIKLPVSGLTYETAFFNAFMLGIRLILNEKDLIHLNKIIQILQCPDNSTISEIINGKIETEFQGYDTLVSIWTALKKEYDKNEYNSSSFKKALDNYCNNENNFLNESEKYLISKDYGDLESRLNTYLGNTIITERSLANLMRSMSIGSLNNTLENGIILSTVHMSKGLEYEVVFIISVNEGIFPDYRSKDEASISEEKHNLFVSITRAKRLCYISYVKNRETMWGPRYQKPSRFLTTYFRDLM